MQIIRSAKWVLYGSVMLAACGVDSSKMEQQYQQAMAAEEEQADQNLAGVELTGSEEDSQQRQELSEESKFRLKALEALVRGVGDQVLECAGMGAEFAAFKQKVDELRAQGKSKEEIQTELKSEHEAIKAKLEENREKFRECRDQAKESEFGIAVHDAVKACFVRPDDNGHDDKMGHRKGRGGDFGRGMPDDENRPDREQGKGRKHGGIREKSEPKGMRLPPLKFQNLETDACGQAITAAESKKPVASDEQTAETAEDSSADAQDESAASGSSTEQAQ